MPVSSPENVSLLSPDIEELIISYLSAGGLTNVATDTEQMPSPPPMPYYIVHCIPGPDDYVTDHPVVSIHAFAPTRTEASDAARAFHRLMKALTPKVAIQMSNGSYVSVDRVLVEEGPHWEDYGDKEIKRYCARYRVETRLNLTT